MTALTIEVPNNKVSFITKLINELGMTVSRTETATKQQPEVMTTEEVLEGLRTSFQQMEQMEEGKLEPITMEELFNEL